MPKNLILEIGHQDAELHSHPDSDEYYIVLDGKILFEHENGEIEIENGGVICFTRGELHRIKKVVNPTRVFILKSTNSIRETDTNSQ